MHITSTQLPAALNKGLAPLYVIHGAEPLLIVEAGDAIRRAAKANGYLERTLLQFEARSDWSQLAAEAGAQSLFGDLRVLDIRIPGGKPGKQGADALIQFVNHLPDDTVSLVTLPQLERDQFKAAWFNALSAAAVMVEARSVDSAQLPSWLQERAKALGMNLHPKAAQSVAQKVEGNLLAAQQELQKLALLCPQGDVNLADVESAVQDVSRYNTQQLIQAITLGQAAAALRAADSVKDQIHSENKNGALIPLLWPLAELLKSAEMGRTKKRLNSDTIQALAGHIALIDRQAKGVAAGDPWDTLHQIIAITAA